MASCAFTCLSLNQDLDTPTYTRTLRLTIGDPDVIAT